MLEHDDLTCPTPRSRYPEEIEIERKVTASTKVVLISSDGGPGRSRSAAAPEGPGRWYRKYAPSSPPGARSMASENASAAACHSSCWRPRHAGPPGLARPSSRHRRRREWRGISGNYCWKCLVTPRSSVPSWGTGFLLKGAEQRWRWDHRQSGGVAGLHGKARWKRALGSILWAKFSPKKWANFDYFREVPRQPPPCAKNPLAHRWGGGCPEIEPHPPQHCAKRQRKILPKNVYRNTGRGGWG